MHARSVCTRMQEASLAMGSHSVVNRVELMRLLKETSELGEESRSFIQGPFDFIEDDIEEIREELPKKFEERICVVCTDKGSGMRRSPVVWESFSLSHADVGGVLGMWKLGVLGKGRRMEEVLKKSQVLASDLDYIKSTVQVQTFKTPLKDPSLIQWKDQDVSTIVPCVFNPNWVERLVTESELMDVYDLDTHHRKAIQSIPGNSKGRSFREYSQGVLNRVLLRVVEWFILNAGEDEHHEHSVVIDQTVLEVAAESKLSLSLLQRLVKAVQIVQNWLWVYWR